MPEETPRRTSHSFAFQIVQGALLEGPSVAVSRSVFLSFSGSETKLEIWPGMIFALNRKKSLNLEKPREILSSACSPLNPRAREESKKKLITESAENEAQTIGFEAPKTRKRAGEKEHP